MHFRKSAIAAPALGLLQYWDDLVDTLIICLAAIQRRRHWDSQAPAAPPRGTRQPLREPHIPRADAGAGKPAAQPSCRREPVNLSPVRQPDERITLHSHRFARSWRRFALVPAAVLAPALIFSAPATAQAGGPPAAGINSRSPLAEAQAPSCPSATLCTWRDSGYRNTRWAFAYSNRPHGRWFFVGSGANDRISSLFNHRAWTSYAALNCPADTVNWTHFPGGGKVFNFADGRHSFPNGHSMNDSISAVALGTSTRVVFPQPGNGQPGSC